MENREELIEWVEKHSGMIPPHIQVVMTSTKQISEEPTHILRMVKEHLISWQGND